MYVMFNFALRDVTLVDIQCYSRLVEGGEGLVDVLNVVVDIIREDHPVIKVDETRHPFILCAYNGEGALETSEGVGESE